MLKGISPILTPKLLKIMAEMGHGDDIVIGDGNFPAASTRKRCIRCDGQGAIAILDAILRLFPLDDFVEAPVTLMEIVPGTYIDKNPSIWNDISKTIAKYEPSAMISFVDRFAFYERSKNAYATIQTGESALYACIILKKGIIRRQDDRFL